MLGRLPGFNSIDPIEGTETRGIGRRAAVGDDGFNSIDPIEGTETALAGCYSD